MCLMGMAKALARKKTDSPNETASKFMYDSADYVFPSNDDNEKQREVCAFLNRLALGP